MYKSLRQGSFSGTMFSSTESLTEEPEPMEPNYNAFNKGKNPFRFLYPINGFWILFINQTLEMTLNIIF